MIRNATFDDKTELIAIAQATELFSPEDLEGFAEMMSEHLMGERLNSENDSGDTWVADDENGLRGAAYYAPEPFTEGTWNLHFIGVHPAEQGKGRGSALIRHVETTLQKKGERLLLVETSGKDDFAQTRAFYQKNGYTEEARIRDYYQAGDDKIIFRKALNS